MPNTQRSAGNPHIGALSIAAVICAVLGVIILISAFFVSSAAVAVAAGCSLLAVTFGLWVVITLFAAWQHENDMIRAGATSAPSDR